VGGESKKEEGVIGMTLEGMVAKKAGKREEPQRAERGVRREFAFGCRLYRWKIEILVSHHEKGGTLWGGLEGGGEKLRHVLSKISEH